MLKSTDFGIKALDVNTVCYDDKRNFYFLCPRIRNCLISIFVCQLLGNSLCFNEKGSIFLS